MDSTRNDNSPKISKKGLSIMRAAAAKTQPNRYRNPMKAKKPAPITLPKLPWTDEDQKS